MAAAEESVQLTIDQGSVPPSKEDLEGEFRDHLLDGQDVAARFGTNVNFGDAKSSKGLTQEEAARRLKVYGVNKLTPPFQKPEWQRFLEKFLDRFILLLLIAGTLSMSLANEDIMNLYLGIILYVVVIVACTLSYIEEGKVSSLMDTFRKMLPQQTRVIRDGAIREVPAEELVVGDVVHLKGGDQVPADIRLCYASNMRVECSSLTGESEPIPVNTTTCDDPTPPHEATNIAFSSSLVLEGDGIGVVVRTSDQTLLGRIANVAMGVKKGKTTLEVEIDRLVNFISVLALVMALVVFIASVAQGTPAADAFVNGFVVIIIANVPQGLQLTVMVALNVSGRRLAKKNVYVKSLNTIETLGSASCICTDKTGTLTQNVMSACHLWVGGEVLHANQLTQGESSRLYWERNPHLQGIINIAAVCNKAAYDDPTFTLCQNAFASELRLLSSSNIDLTTIAQMNQPQDEGNVGGGAKVAVAARRDESLSKIAVRAKMSSTSSIVAGRGRTNRRPSLARGGSVRGGANASKDPSSTPGTTGDASDVGLMKFCDSITPIYATRDQHDVICEVPFNSTNKYSCCIVRPPQGAEDQRRELWIKGAPEIVLAMCTHHEANGQTLPIDAGFHEKYDQAYKSFAKQGERVLGFAKIKLDAQRFGPDHDHRYVAGTDAFPELKDLIFTGLISLVDPPREGVKEAVATCRQAGVKVIMVTGDHPLTGAAIARKVGIIGEFYTAEELAEAQNIKPEEVPADMVGAVVVHGHKLNNQPEEYWDHILSHQEIVFARTTPEQKLEIVKHCQRLGEVVAVTGDGVNDAPALRQANIGIAMGTVGSDVSRNAANVVLVTNDWASIVVGIEEGRVIFDNLVKSIAYTLTHLWPEVFPSILALVFGFPFLLEAILVLMIDLGTEMFPAVALAYEGPEPGLMQRPPRDMEKDRLVTKPLLAYAYLEAGVAELFAALMGAFFVFWHYDIPLSVLPFSNDQYWGNGNDTMVINDSLSYTQQEQKDIIFQVHSGYFIGLVGSQALHIWVLRSRQVPMIELNSWNVVAIYGVIIEVLILCFIVYMPFSQQFFTTANPPSIVWVTPLFFAAFVWPFVEGRKVYARKYPESCVKKYFGW